MTATIRTIGILALIMAVASFLIPYQVAVEGAWFSGGYVGSVDVSPLFTSFPLVGIFISIAAAVIGVGTLRRKKWTWKGNVVLQAIVIPILISTIVLPFFMTHLYAYDLVVPYHNLILLAISTVILVLLLQPKVRTEFGKV